MSKEQLTKDIEEYFDKIDDNWERAKISVSFNEIKYQSKDTSALHNCTIHITKMYEGLGKLVSFQALKWLSEKLGTDQINLENENYRPGCDTCDYGSEHSVDINCLNVQI